MRAFMCSFTSRVAPTQTRKVEWESDQGGCANVSAHQRGRRGFLAASELEGPLGDVLNNGAAITRSVDALSTVNLLAVNGSWVVACTISLSTLLFFFSLPLLYIPHKGEAPHRVYKRVKLKMEGDGR